MTSYQYEIAREVGARYDIIISMLIYVNEYRMLMPSLRQAHDKLATSLRQARAKLLWKRSPHFARERVASQAYDKPTTSSRQAPMETEDTFNMVIDRASVN